MGAQQVTRLLSIDARHHTAALLGERMECSLTIPVNSHTYNSSSVAEKSYPGGACGHGTVSQSLFHVLW
jgi:hypothetical protein